MCVCFCGGGSGGCTDGAHRSITTTTDRLTDPTAPIVRSTPWQTPGMKKLVVNHLEKIIVTSDCATIVKELEVQHPAAKMLVLAAEMQEKECGDATNLVVSFAGELLKKAEDLLHTGLHTSEIVAGYKAAFEKAMEILPTLTVHTVRHLFIHS